MAKKRGDKSIYDKYREILRRPKLSDEEIDKMRKNIRLLALAITEHVLKSKVNQIY
ncbi:MAG: hypothetical protein PHD13_04140 [Methanocellales archaeon]|nr:hypothetical protein [Methanocellales archaeon]MDD3292107.1 hypothetical protein [Methanocellales archaeon]MDD5235344.1 hypothetical protein [Methanocellales archaeon]MDD5485708.1 hypothetical protein [Methanocellales archaeon]